LRPCTSIAIVLGILKKLGTIRLRATLTTKDIVLCILVGVIGVVDCLCVRLLCRVQAVVGVKSEGARVAKFVPRRFVTERVHISCRLMIGGRECRSGMRQA
jgi:hypothetical protein